MSKEKYSIYDFPELLYNSKLLTNRQRCIVLCLFSFLNLKGGGAFSIDILAEKTGIRKDHIYCELKQLPFIKREGKKILLDIKKLREFITTKLGSSNRPNIGLNKTQNRSLEKPNIGLNKTQNGSKTFLEEQGTQELDGCVNNILRKDSLDKKFKKKNIENIYIHTENNLDSVSINKKTSNIVNKEGTVNKTISKEEVNKEVSDKVVNKEANEEVNKEKLTERRGKEVEKENSSSLSTSSLRDEKQQYPRSCVLESNKTTKERVTDTLISRVVEEIKNNFKVSYKQKFGRYPGIDRKSMERVEEFLRLSAESAEELGEIANRLIRKIPEFFKITDKWVMKNGYSFYAFSWKLKDLLSEPVSYQSQSSASYKVKFVEMNL